MLKFSLKIKNGAHGELILHISPLIRILFGLMACALIAGALINRSEPVPILGVALIIFAFLGMFYEERWIFDKAKKTIIAKTGLVFFYKKDVLVFKEVEAFVYNVSPEHKLSWNNEKPGKSVFPGMANRYYLFALDPKKGKRKTIELVKGRESDYLKTKAEMVAEYCNIKLQTELAPAKQEKD